MAKDGESAPVVVQGKSDPQKLFEQRASLASDPRLAPLMTSYGQGSLSLDDLLNQARGAGKASRDKYAADRDKYVSDRIAKGKADYEAGQNAARAKMAAAGISDPLQAAMKGVISNDEVGGLTQAFNEDWSRQQVGQEFDSSNKMPGDIDENALMSLITTDPATASRYMTDQLRTNELTKGLFGAGGTQDQSQQAYKDALDISMGRKPMSTEDRDLYGQMSGDIARQSASEEQSLMQALADRGLASAPSGAAGVGFSGLQGNKTERLATAQRQVAQQRVDNAMKNAQMAGQMTTQLGQLGQGALSNMYNRNLAGRGQTMNELASSAGQSLAQQQAQQNALNTQFEQQQATKGPGLGDILGGVGTGLLGAATGGIGAAVGSGLSGIFGGGKSKAPSESEVSTGGKSGGAGALGLDFSKPDWWKS